MRLANLAVAAAMTVSGVRGGEPQRGEQTLTVYLEGENLVPPQIRWGGERIASRIFAAIGVRLEWRHHFPRPGQAQREQAMVVRIQTAPAAGASLDSMGAALPFEGETISVFYESMKWAETFPRLAPVLFGHILAHEISHNLERLDHHSQTGVMKAHWSAEDLKSMTTAPLGFEPEDVIWILQGLNARAALVAAAR